MKEDVFGHSDDWFDGYEAGIRIEWSKFYDAGCTFAGQSIFRAVVTGK